MILILVKLMIFTREDAAIGASRLRNKRNVENIGLFRSLTQHECKILSSWQWFLHHFIKVFTKGITMPHSVWMAIKHDRVSVVFIAVQGGILIVCTLRLR